MSIFPKSLVPGRGLPGRGFGSYEPQAGDEVAITAYETPLALSRKSSISGRQRLASGGKKPVESTAEVGVAYKGTDQGGFGCPDLGPYLLGGGPVCHYVQVRDMDHDFPHWECVGWIPLQLGPQADREATLAREGQHMGIPPAG